MEAALVSAHLYKATLIARQLSITSSNARAVALRAGEKSSGFKPLTDFIDHLANVTIKSSKKINKLANALSQTASNMFRAEQAIVRFDQVFERSDRQTSYIETLVPSLLATNHLKSELLQSYNRQINQLVMSLTDLRGELRTAKILTTLARVEASQADVEYQASLDSVADSVEQAASGIKFLIEDSLSIVIDLKQEHK